MCGRYVSALSDDDLISEFDVEQVVGDPPPPSWNVAPTDPVRIVVQRPPHEDHDAGPVRQLRTVQWGLLPSWSKSRTGGAKMINARSETVASKPAFKTAAARRRCLTPASGYYEWKAEDGRKVPFFLHDQADATLAMAGLYEIWRDDSLPADDPARWVWTTTIITRAAADSIGEIHDRCPVLVPAALQARWLDCGTDDPATAQQLLADMPEPRLVPLEVGRAVGNVKNNGPQLIEPAADAPGQAALPLE